MGTSVQPLVAWFSMRIPTSLLSICFNRRLNMELSPCDAIHDPRSRIASLPAHAEDLFADLARMTNLGEYGRTPSLLVLVLPITAEHSRQRLLIIYLYLSRNCHCVDQPRIFGCSAAGLSDSALARVAIES